MATGVSGYFDLTGDYGVTLRVHYSETYEATTNQSVVRISALQVMSSWYSGVTYYLDGTVSVEGSTAVSMSSSAGTNSVTLSALNAFYNVGGTLGAVSGITHNNDGTKSITISVTVRGFTRTGGGGSGWTVSGSKAVTLATIPRASTIGATDANIGSTSIIAVNRKSNAYTHSIQFVFGNVSGYITASGEISSSEVKLSATSIPFVLPTSFYGQIPNAKTGTGTLYCRTYSGNTQIGSTQTCSFRATAAESICRPNVSGSIQDANEITIALTGDSWTLVRYYSTAVCRITATAKNSASIVSRTVNGVNTVNNAVTYSNIETNKFTFATQDSRGYTNAVTYDKAMVPYVRLTNNATAIRTDPTSGNAILTLSGDYFNGSFGAVANELTASYKVNSETEVFVTPAIDGDRYYATIPLSGLDYTTSHTIEVTVLDKLAVVTKKIIVNQGIPVFDWGEKDFKFNVPVLFDKGPLYESKEFPGCFYNVINGIQEWINPPMIAGVEYRTVERCGGKAVYKKYIEYTSEALPTSQVVAIIQIPHGITGFSQIISAFAAKNDYLIPGLSGTQGHSAIARVHTTGIEFRYINDNFSAGVWRFYLTYTKTSE